MISRSVAGKGARFIPPIRAVQLPALYKAHIASKKLRPTQYEQLLRISYIL